MPMKTEKGTYLTVILPNCYSSEEVQHQALNLLFVHSYTLLKSNNWLTYWVMRMNNCLPKWELVTTASISCYPPSSVCICMQLRDSQCLYELPVCHYNLYKRSFVLRNLFLSAYWLFIDLLCCVYCVLLCCLLTVFSITFWWRLSVSH